jgi:hypothetical protein
MKTSHSTFTIRAVSPTFSPAGRTYTTAQMSLSASPRAATLYAGPLTVSASATIAFNSPA